MLRVALLTNSNRLFESAALLYAGHMPWNREDLTALHNLISEAKTIVATTTLPEGRAERAKELLEAAMKLSEELLKTRYSAAQTLGRKGGLETKRRGPEYFRQIAAMRKTNAGGRPHKVEN